MNFKEMTLLQLKAYAKEKGIRGVSTLKKNQLIERIIASENKSIQTKAEESIKSEKNTTSENGIKTEKNAKSENGIKTEGSVSVGKIHGIVRRGGIVVLLPLKPRQRTDSDAVE